MRMRARFGLVMLVAFVSLPVATATSSPAAAVVSPPDVATAGGSVIVSLDPATPFVTRFVLAREVTRPRAGAVTFANGTGFAVSLDPDEVAALRKVPGVRAITPNRELTPQTAPHIELTGANVAWETGWRGAGQTIVIIDTGVDTTNPNLAGKVVSEACFTPSRGAGGDCPNGASAQSSPGAAVPCTGNTDCSHGTHVASVAAGGGPVVFGVAPAASIAAVQVFASVKDTSDRVVTDEASLIRALEWVDTARATQPIAAVNLSLGGAPVSTPCDASPALVTLIDRLTSVGIPVVASAGNDASTSMLSFPACIPRVVSVGAEGQAGRSASFANTAPTLSLFAPGESIEGAWVAPCCVRTLSGTSFAAPQVSATFALLREQHGPAPVDERLGLLRRTGEPVFATGSGRWSGVTTLRVARSLDPQYQSARPAAVPRGASPFGSFDALAVGPTGVRVTGWVLDGDTVAPVTVHAYVDGVFSFTAVASLARPDVGTAYPGYGNRRGFDLPLAVTTGDHTVCVYALDLGTGQGNVLLGCRRASIGPVIGALDVAIAAAGTVALSGWAIDTARLAPTVVELLVDDVVVATGAADTDRPDVGAVYPAYGSTHGYVIDGAAARGAHRVCIRAASNATRPVAVLGCRDLDMPTGLPVGVIDATAVSASAVVVAGWVIDPDTTAPVDVVVQVDGNEVVARADLPRPDLLRGAPGYGARHGFQVSVPVSAGARLCVFGVDVTTRERSLIGCVDFAAA